MATASYIQGRQKYLRPQAILWSDNFGTLDSGIAVPTGSESTNFLILSDHGRKEVKMSKDRLENRQRLVNGTMRSYHVADKNVVSLSWEMLPSRAYNQAPAWNSVGYTAATDYTVDGGAGGTEMLEWYENTTGPFYMMLAYDKKDEFTSSPYSHLAQYNQLLHVYFKSFEYDIQKRTPYFDYWDVQVELEEV